MATSASSFSKLLRQSKFATYDPAINQAYASFGGYSHRGHWGTKRDLPPKRKHKVSDPLISTSGSRGNSRRNPVAFISALDSAEGQTEWASAEKDVRWLRRLEELGTGVELHGSSAWVRRVGSIRGRPIGAVDSEFDTTNSTTNTALQTTTALPNTQAMSERRFRSYIARLRAQRQEFHEFLQDSRVGQSKDPDNESGTPEAIPMYHYAQSLSAFHTRFLAHTNQKAAIQPKSRALTPVPHPSAGLDYLSLNPLANRLLYPNPVKGRYVENMSKAQTLYSQRYEGGSIVSVAGHNANLVESQPTVQAIDWQKFIQGDFSQSMENTASEYRVDRLELEAIPQVIGQSRQGLQSARIKMQVRDWSKHAERQENPHPPGSYEYVSHEDNRTLTPTPTSFKGSVTTPISKGHDLHVAPNSELMDMLDALLAESQDAPPKK